MEATTSAAAGVATGTGTAYGASVGGAAGAFRKPGAFGKPEPTLDQQVDELEKSIAAFHNVGPTPTEVIGAVPK